MADKASAAYFFKDLNENNFYNLK